MTENGESGIYCQAITWTATRKLAKVDENSFVFDEGVLSWDQVLFAESYKIMIVNASNGAVSNKISNENSVVLTNLTEGSYTVFVMAQSENENIQDSDFSEGYLVVI